MTNRITTPPKARTVIVGVDTHKHVHVAVAIDSWGIRLGDHAFVADSGGYEALVTWAEGTDAPICQDSRSRSQVCGLARSVVCHHALKNLAGEKACETADDLPFGPPFSGASFDVVEGW